MAETKPLILYSRSAVVTDWSCQRKRFLGYEFEGRGLSAKTTALELFLGTVTHDGLSAIAHGVDIDKIADAAKTQLRTSLLEGIDTDSDAEYFAEEQCALVEGLLRGFSRQVWPTLHKLYPEIVRIEEEMLYEHDGLTFMAKPDLIVRDTDGQLVYIEYKTTSSVKDQWINSWTTAVQLHSSVKAVEATLGEPVPYVIVVGLNKGYVSYNKQNSIFCYAYHKPAEPPFIKAVWSHEWRSGLKKYPVWLRDGGVKRWVEELPADILQQQFPQTPPIMINNYLVDTFFKQRAQREAEIRMARECMQVDPSQTDAIMNRVFQQNFEACNPGWGKGCQFRQICHGSVPDPLQGGFELRHSHHAVEEEALNAG